MVSFWVLDIRLMHWLCKFVLLVYFFLVQVQSTSVPKVSRMEKYCWPILLAASISTELSNGYRLISNKTNYLGF